MIGGTALSPADAKIPSGGLPLLEAHFQPLVRNGFDDPGNAYSHAMGWFNEHLYVGTTRFTLCGSTSFDRSAEMEIWPIKVPDITWEVDWRAQLWRFDPLSGVFEQVYISPMLLGSKGFEVPMQVGFREMKVFRGRSDRQPALYVTAWGSHMGPGPSILRCVDGRTFEDTPIADREHFGNKTLRPLQAFNGWLFTANAGRVAQTDTDQRGGLILASDDPASGRWQLACEPCFGDLRNTTVFEMEVFHGFLYAGTMNPYEGLELWRTDAEGSPPFRWTRVIAQGVGRGKLNEVVMCLCVFNDALYVGTGIYNCGYDRIYNVGPNWPEVFRVHPDGSWDLLVGEARQTPDGLKVPTSGLRPGFGSPFVGYIWRLCAHDGWLYASTAVWSPWIPYSRRDRWSEEAQRLFTPDKAEQFVEKFGGFDLWRSQDGEHWEPVTRCGFGNRYNMGARTMVSSQHGLFVGTVSQFGPKVAVRRAAGWRYEPNERSGCEIWLGRQGRYPHEVTVKRLEPAPPWRAAPPPITTPRRDSGDLVDEFYGQTDWRNVGYWAPHIKNAAKACENLLDELNAFTLPDEVLKVPGHPTPEAMQRWLDGSRCPPHQSVAVAADPPRRESVLDLGCQRGMSTHYLLKHFAPEGVVGVTGEKADLSACRINCPRVRIVHAKLPKLKLEPDSFDYVFCIEGPSALGLPRLLRGVFEVLKPGGQLLCADLLYEDSDLADDPACYRRAFEDAGFVNVRVLDATERCALAFRQHVTAFMSLKTLSREADAERLQQFQRAIAGGTKAIAYYVLVSALKPVA